MLRPGARELARAVPRPLGKAKVELAMASSPQRNSTIQGVSQSNSDFELRSSLLLLVHT
jgi:hypothetical protein